MIGLYLAGTRNVSVMVQVLPLLLLFPLLVTCGVRPGPWRWLAVTYTTVMALCFHAVFIRVNLLTPYLWGCILANWLGHLLPREESWD
jgi:hypothetical protein